MVSLQKKLNNYVPGEIIYGLIEKYGFHLNSKPANVKEIAKEKEEMYA